MLKTTTPTPPIVFESRMMNPVFNIRLAKKATTAILVGLADLLKYVSEQCLAFLVPTRRLSC